MRVLAILLGLTCVVAQAQAANEECGPIKNAFGPFDYRFDKGNLPIVEDHHFTPRVEHLVSGESGPIASDIDYTLRAFPNHPRALMAMTKLGERLRSDRMHGATYPVYCYYDRAVRFRPDDGTVRLLYANFLMKRGKTAEATEQVEQAEKLAGQSANMHYNLGLAYLEFKNYDKALQHAHQAYALGFPLPGLRNRLERIGKWVPDPKGANQQQAKAAPSSEPVQDPAAAK